jgi:hypothetical protein
MKLFPLVAESILGFLVSNYIDNGYFEMQEQIKNDNFTKMDEMHHLTSGFKSLHTQQCYDGLIQIR